jgi:hypothetical protein
MIINLGNNKMPEHTKKIHKQEIDTLKKPLRRFLIGTAALYSLLFFGALYFLILI